MRSGDASRAMRFTQIGWTAVALIGLAWQAKSLIDVWPDRDTRLHSLGGAAAHAALTADRAGADVIYVASVDGTPRRFGAGSLPGLQYPWFKWFDPRRSLPLPLANTTAVYMLSELAGQPREGDLTGCLGAPDWSGEVFVRADQARTECVPTSPTEHPIDATFPDLARVEALLIPTQGVAGDPLDTRLVWEPLVAHPETQQFSLQLGDPASADGLLSGNGTLDLYPSNEWQPGELVLSRLPVATDPTAIPQTYRLTLGIAPTRPNAGPAMATWQGLRTERIPVATVTLTLANVAEAQSLPSDMQPVAGPAVVVDGGLELVGAQALPPEAAIGSPLRVGLLWKALEDAPSASDYTLRLVRASGEVVQQASLPLFGGRLEPSSLRTGNVVRDEQSLVIASRAPNEALSVELQAGETAPFRLGTVNVTGRAHVMDSSATAPEATFGGAMALLSDQIEQSGAKVTVRLRWRAEAEMEQAYKVFVHVLDPAGAQVVAQRDQEPQAGVAPTTSWVIGETIDDEYVIALPAGLGGGEYPVEVGVYDPKTGERLHLDNGDNHLVLTREARVTQ